MKELLDEKICTKCKAKKLISCFVWRKDQNKYRGTCKECYAAAKSVYEKKRYQENKSYYKEKNDRWFKENEEYMKERRRERYLNNKEKELRQTTARKRFRMKNDPAYKIVQLCRQRLGEAVKSALTKKAGKTREMIGCSPQELKTYIESKFYGGMTWETLGVGYGKWQIDHIEPVSMFLLKYPENQKRAFHYTNLQPLWYEDHLKKTKIDNMRVRTTKRICKRIRDNFLESQQFQNDLIK